MSYKQVSPEKSKVRPDAQTLRLRPGGAQNRKIVSGQKQGFSNLKQHIIPTISKTMMQTGNSIHLCKSQFQDP